MQNNNNQASVLLERLNLRIRRMVSKAARRCPWMEAEDLASAAREAVMEALPRINWSHPVEKIDAFTMTRVNWRIGDEVRAASHETARDSTRRRRYMQAVIAVEQRLGRAAELAEIQAHLNVGDDEFAAMLGGLQANVREIYACTDDLEVLKPERPPALVDIPDTAPALQEVAEGHDMRECVAAALSRLPARQAQVLQGLYLLGEQVSEVSRRLGVSRPRVCQLRDSGLRRLRTLLTAMARERNA